MMTKSTDSSGMKEWVTCIGKYPRHAMFLTKVGVNTECVVEEHSYEHQLGTILSHKKEDYMF